MLPTTHKPNQLCHSEPSIQYMVSCEHCELHGFLNLLETMKTVQPGIIERTLLRQQAIPKGEQLFCPGQPFHSIYAVKSGAFKSFLRPLGGDEQVLSFHLPGELIGLESLLSSGYSCTTQALEPSSVCRLSMNDLDIPQQYSTAFQQLVIQILTRQVCQERRQSLLASRLTADERVAAFLVNISERFSTRGFTEDTFRLSMLRPDIASYLGLAVETVSRTLTRFKEKKLIENRGKAIRLLDIPCMRSIAQHCEMSSRSLMEPQKNPTNMKPE